MGIRDLIGGKGTDTGPLPIMRTTQPPLAVEMAGRIYDLHQSLTACIDQIIRRVNPATGETDMLIAPWVVLADDYTDQLAAALTALIELTKDDNDKDSMQGPS